MLSPSTTTVEPGRAAPPLPSIRTPLTSAVTMASPLHATIARAISVCRTVAAPAALRRPDRGTEARKRWSQQDRARWPGRSPSSPAPRPGSGGPAPSSSRARAPASSSSTSASRSSKPPSPPSARRRPGRGRHLRRRGPHRAGRLRQRRRAGRPDVRPPGRRVQQRRRRHALGRRHRRDDRA